MSSCVVKIDSQEYDGEYEIEDRKAKVEINNFSSGTSVANGESVRYIEIEIYDLRNKIYIYSPAFFIHRSLVD